MISKIISEKHKMCLHWSQEKTECMLTKKGVFIPTQHHIEVFCHTTNFIKCHHYVQSMELTLQEKIIPFFQVLEDNRRFFKRKEGSYSVKLESCNEEGASTGMFEAEALTIDLSAGGMRLETNSKIPQSRFVSFKFGEDFFIPDFEGFGEIKWSGQNGTNNFQTGISFVENRVKRAIGAHIGFI